MAPEVTLSLRKQGMNCTEYDTLIESIWFKVTLKFKQVTNYRFVVMMMMRFVLENIMVDFVSLLSHVALVS